MTGGELRLVVVAPDVLVDAEVHSSPTWDTWPLVPPRTTNASADVLGICLHRPNWALTVSRAVLELTVDALVSEWELPEALAADYAGAVVDLARMSGGGLFQPHTGGPLGPGVAPDVRAVTALSELLQADAVVTGAPGRITSVWDPEDVWVASPDSFADHAPHIEA